MKNGCYQLYGDKDGRDNWEITELKNFELPNKWQSSQSIHVDPSDSTIWNTLKQGHNPANTFGPAVTCFSDSIIVSMNLSHNDPTAIKYSRLETFFRAISIIMYEGLKKGYKFRGAISYGNLYHKNNVVAGDAYIESCEYEKKANYPRVILTKSILSIFSKYSEGNFYGWKTDGILTNFFIEKDEDDGNYYLNYSVSEK